LFFIFFLSLSLSQSLIYITIIHNKIIDQNLIFQNFKKIENDEYEKTISDILKNEEIFNSFLSTISPYLYDENDQIEISSSSLLQPTISSNHQNNQQQTKTNFLKNEIQKFEKKICFLLLKKSKSYFEISQV